MGGTWKRNTGKGTGGQRDEGGTERGTSEPPAQRGAGDTAECQAHLCCLSPHPGNLWRSRRVRGAQRGGGSPGTPPEPPGGAGGAHQLGGRRGAQPARGPGRRPGARGSSRSCAAPSRNSSWERREQPGSGLRPGPHPTDSPLPPPHTPPAIPVPPPHGDPSPCAPSPQASLPLCPQRCSAPVSSTAPRHGGTKGPPWGPCRGWGHPGAPKELFQGRGGHGRAGKGLLGRVTKRDIVQLAQGRTGTPPPEGGPEGESEATSSPGGSQSLSRGPQGHLLHRGPKGGLEPGLGTRRKRNQTIQYLLRAEGSRNKCPFSMGKLLQGMVLWREKVGSGRQWGGGQGATGEAGQPSGIHDPNPCHGRAGNGREMGWGQGHGVCHIDTPGMELELGFVTCPWGFPSARSLFRDEIPPQGLTWWDNPGM